MSSLARDLRYAARSLVRRPGFTAVALVTLALGIGANTAVFSVVNGILLNRLPYREPGRLVTLGNTFISNAELLYLQEHARSFESVAAYSPGWGMTLTSAGEPVQLTAAKVSVNFLPVIGVSPALGRPFATDDAVPGQDRVVLLDHVTWRNRFAADPAVVGRAITLDGQPYIVAGVLPEDFHFYSNSPAHLLAPIAIDPSAWYHRGQIALGVARLAAGKTAAGAQAEIRSLVPAMREAFEYKPDYGQNLTVVSLTDFTVGPVRTILLVLLGAVGFLVLIAAVNVGNLVLVRVSERRRELAVRTALGASRWQVVRGMAAEGVLLALGGTVLGLVLAVAGVAALRGTLPADTPRLAEVAIDGRVLLACALVGVVTGLFGVLPALAASRVDPQTALGSARGSGGASRHAGHVRGALVSVEVALALVLVTGAALMLRTLWRLSDVDPGFRAERTAAFRMQPTARLTAAEATRFFTRVVEDVAALPGVTAAGGIHHLPLSGYNWWADIDVEGRPRAVGEATPRAGSRIIIGDYLRAMGIVLRQGRAFDSRDDPGAEPVAMINDVLAHRLFPGESPLGRRLRGGNATRNDWVRVVGVVSAVRHEALDVPASGELYLPLAQTPMSFLNVVARTTADPRALVVAAQRAARRLDPTIAISEPRTLEDVVYTSTARRRLVLRLLLIFAGLGVTLGTVGVYGVAAFGVTQRTQEIGVRMALGAAHHSIVSMVVGTGLRYAGIGLASGTIAALAASRAMRGMLYDVSTSDPATYVTVALVVLAITVLANWIPARRAARVDPLVAIRSDR